MSASNLPSYVASARRLLTAVAVFAFVPGAGQAAAPGITGTSFSLAASPAYVTQPECALIYSWGYGCAAPPPTSAYMPSVFGSIGFCPTMQMPGPTLIVTEGATVTVTLTNNLPTGAGNTRSEEHTSELQSRVDLVCRLLLEKKKKWHQNEVFC